MAKYLSIYFEDEYWVYSDNKKETIPSEMGEFYDTKDSMIENGVDLPTIYLK